jgi:hypothetical protein
VGSSSKVYSHLVELCEVGAIEWGRLLVCWAKGLVWMCG